MPILAQVRIQGSSGLPEDVYINTFHFAGGSLSSAQADTVVGLIDDLYTLPVVGVGTAIEDYMAVESIDRMVDAEVRFYIEVAGPSGDPVETRSFSWDLLLTGADLPEECAVVISQHAKTGAGVLIARGRQYIGPMGTVAKSTRSDGHTEVNSVLREAFAGAADRFRVASNSAGFPWVVVSRKTGTPVGSGITGGFVDNAFDTQRRRGVRASTRNTFGVP